MAYRNAEKFPDFTAKIKKMEKCGPMPRQLFHRAKLNLTKKESALDYKKIG
jgi:hypothetical protein